MRLTNCSFSLVFIFLKGKNANENPGHPMEKKKWKKKIADVCVKEESRKYFSVCSLKDFTDYSNN